MASLILWAGDLSADLTDKLFGRWTVKLYAGKRGKNHYWECVCLCGTTRAVAGYALTGETTGSCGCLKSEQMRAKKTRHGGKGTPEYIAWKNLRARCGNPKKPVYRYYGGRGIKCCERWNDFANFLADVGHRPTADCSIDRINADGHYEPSNCRWATKTEQANNRCNSHRLDHNGRTHTIAEWGELLDLSAGMLYTRIRAGWPVELALTLPPGSWPKNIPRTAEFRLKGKAWAAVQKAVKDGVLIRPSRCCVAGCESTKKIHAHHHNGYDEAHRLDVVWLCPAHHNDRTFGRTPDHE